MRFQTLGFIVLLLSVVTYGQTARLTGTLYDSNGAMIVGALVSGIDQSKKVFETKTNREGTYELELKPGLFTVRFESMGFKSMVFENFRLVDSKKKSFQWDVVLEVGECGDCHPIALPDWIVDQNEPTVPSAQISPKRPEELSRTPNKKTTRKP